MTIIAWDGNELAVDSQVSHGEVIHTLKGIKFAYTPRGVAAFAGLMTAGRHFLRVLIDGGDMKDVDFSELTGVVVIGKRKLETYDHYIPEVFTGTKYAVGSGYEVAYGALHAGATATQAAAICAKILKTCGGKIHTFKGT